MQPRSEVHGRSNDQSTGEEDEAARVSPHELKAPDDFVLDATPRCAYAVTVSNAAGPACRACEKTSTRHTVPPPY